MPSAPWSEQIRDWMTSLRAHLLRYPAVLHRIGRRGRTSPARLDGDAYFAFVVDRTIDALEAMVGVVGSSRAMRP